MDLTRRADRQLVSPPVEDLGPPDGEVEPSAPVDGDWGPTIRSFARLWARAYIRAQSGDEPEPEQGE